MSIQPGDVAARSEHTGLANAGEMGSECQTCARPMAVKFFYDDPLNTPITDLEVKLADMSGGVLVDAINTEAPVSRGLQDATSGVGALRPDLGGVTHGEVPYSAGALTVTTNPSQNIPTAAEEAWQIEQDIVASLEQFESSMKVKFQPYVDEWQRDGALGAIGDYYEGVGKGVVSWWDGEKDFWGTAWGALKGSAAAIGGYIAEANAEGLPLWVPNSTGINVGLKLGRDFLGLFDGVEILDFLESLGKLMRAFLAGDIDGIVRELENLTGLEDLPGAIGEFGTMIKEALADGVDWMRDMIEVLRRTPVLNLMVNTAMRCILLMTPNFWAQVLGEGVGFIIPELLIWLVTTIIAGLSVGAGATVLAVRCAGIASKIRKAIKGSRHVSNILAFLDELKPIFDKIGDLAKKLRQSIEETKTGIIDSSQRVVRSSRYWRGRLDELARQGHGPQRHEGDVTDSQLLNRSLHGFDPMTNSPVDFDKFRKKYKVDYDPIAHGTPPNFGGRSINVPGKGDLPIVMNSKISHVAGDHATKFNTPADFVRAYDEVVKDGRFKSFAGPGDGDFLAINDFPASKVFGRNFSMRMKGYDILGQPTEFGPNTKIVAIFRKVDGIPQLVSLYPNP
ncbi:hypothetical protein [uncultured Litoreibacter sp.]|uniref:hypothetical protein n=1 Tax=uncultured Litoreibacter sp. TaxID=1392394 RepID=UPI002610BA7C|nr:hypothetical protein [uncultured Litoreibacter sp.]